MEGSASAEEYATLKDSVSSSPEVEEETKEVSYPSGSVDLVVDLDSLTFKECACTEPIEANGVHWYLKVFPKGFDNRSFISAYIGIKELETAPRNREINVGVKLWVENLQDPDDCISSISSHVLSRSYPDWGFKELAERKVLLDPSAGFLIPNEEKKNLVRVHGLITFLPPPEVLKEKQFFKNPRQDVGFVGIKNQGATCYLNSLIQTLYFTSAITASVFMMPTENDDPNTSVALALQRLFFNLKFSPGAVSTVELTKSFGWDKEDSFQQHDVQELDRVLVDKLETKMKGTPAEGSLKKLLCGVEKHSIKCTNVEFESIREEEFYDLSLDVENVSTLQKSLEKYTEEELLDGENKYDAGKFGKQTAKKGSKFKVLPPVLHIQLKRWVFDWYKNEGKKLDTRFEFPMTLDMNPYMSSDTDTTVDNVYELFGVLIHHGGASGGHYYAFIRPTVKDEWYEFNDTHVGKCEKNRLLGEGFGGRKFSYFEDGVVNTSFTVPDTSAYMLVYIRKQDIPSVIFHIKGKSIPLHLHQKFAEDLKEMEEEEEERVTGGMNAFVKVITDKHLKENENRTRDLVDPRTLKGLTSLKVARLTTLKELYQIIAEKLGVPVGRVRLYPLTERKNGMIRTLPCIESSTVKLTLLIKNNRIAFYAHVVPEDGKEDGFDIPPAPEDSLERCPPNDDDLAQIFFKQYIPRESKMVYLGHKFYKIGCRASILFSDMMKAASLKESDKVIIFDDRKSFEQINSEGLNEKRSLGEMGIRHGDCLIIQKDEGTEPSEGLENPRVSDFYAFRSSMVSVNVNKRNGLLSEAFELHMSKGSSYDSVVAAICEKAKADPQFVRLTGYSSMLCRYCPLPFKASEKPTLENMLDSKEFKQHNDTLSYEILDMPVTEAEKLLEIRLAVYNGAVKVISHESVITDKKATVAQVLEQFAKKHTAEGEEPKKYRLCKPRARRLILFQDETEVASIIKDYPNVEFRIEEIPSDEENFDEKTSVLLHCVHFEQDTSGTASIFGDPFNLVVPKNSTVQDVIPLVCQRLQLTEDDVKKWKYAAVRQTYPTILKKMSSIEAFFDVPDKVLFGLMHRNYMKKVSSQGIHIGN